MKKHYSLMLVAASLMGCSTAYQHSDMLSYGFSEKQLSENVWRVTFEGNSSTGINEAYDKATLRAADLAISHGYIFFIISDVQNTNRASTHTMPKSSTTMVTPVTGGQPVLVTTHGSGMTFTSNYPTSTLTASMYKDKPGGDANVYDARFVCQKLGAEFDVKCGQAK